jgi:hypothetical protein
MNALTAVPPRHDGTTVRRMFFKVISAREPPGAEPRALDGHGRTVSGIGIGGPVAALRQ